MKYLILLMLLSSVSLANVNCINRQNCSVSITFEVDTHDNEIITNDSSHLEGNISDDFERKIDL